MTTITSLPLDKLAVSPQNVRKTRGKSSFDDLKASILAHGLLNNLVVTQADKGMYYVVAGARRLTDDHSVQRKIYKAVKDNPHPHSIRRMLTDKKMGSRDKLARFVGLDAYEKAGGKITGDLFNAEQYLDDPALLEELAVGKLKALEETLKAEGLELGSCRGGE